ncbi:MAG: hypothetical protein ACRC3B_15520 [Bacteroidia bacterium]
MKKIILIAFLMLPMISFAQKENQLEFNFAYGNTYNYGAQLKPVSYHYIGLGGSSRKDYYGISSEVKPSSQFGVLFYPKKIRIGDFGFGLGFQYLVLRSTVTADSLVTQSRYSFPPYSPSYSKTENLKWDVVQSMIQVPIVVRYQSISEGKNGIYADLGILFSSYRNGFYPDGITSDAESGGQMFRAYTFGAGYQRKVQLEETALYINAGATYQRTWTASVLGQKHGFIGLRVSCAVDWNLNGK